MSTVGETSGVDGETEAETDAAAASLPAADRPSSPRLARHRITVGDGHQVGVAVCGHGLPVVLVHGFTAEGILYAQPLSRLVSMGFKVVAVDVAGHGATAGLPTGGAGLSDYADLLGQVLDHLGIPRAVLVGHSLGGRLVVQLAATDPERALAVVLIDAAVGETWDRLVRVSRVAPPVLAGLGGLLLADALTTLPVLRDRTQAVKLGRLVAPTVVGNALHPWRLVGPVVSLVRSGPSQPLLATLAERRVPVVVIHGDRDIVVPYRTGEDAARQADGILVTVHGGSHSWLLKDPETLPAIVSDLLAGRVGDRLERILADDGLDPSRATPEVVEAAFLPADALVRQLTPEPADRRRTTGAVGSPRPESRPPKQPRYRWTIEEPAPQFSSRSSRSQAPGW
jgi:pimeloyl-ACP methyl ester carboxylesterase